MQKSYTLVPDDGRKSFYGKATVIVRNSAEYLKSYNTIVAVKKGKKLYRTNWYIENPNYRLNDFDNWSSTTGRHIKAFCGLNKAAYLTLPIYRVRCDLWKI